MMYKLLLGLGTGYVALCVATDSITPFMRILLAVLLLMDACAYLCEAANEWQRRKEPRWNIIARELRRRG